MTNDLKQRVTDGTLRSLIRETIDKGLIYWEPNTVRGHERKAELIARLEAALSVSGEADQKVWISERDLEFLREGSYREAPVFNYEEDHRVPLYAHPAPSSGEAVADYQWKTIDGWISAGGDAHAQFYAKQMAASIGLGYRELYAHPSPSSVQTGVAVKALEKAWTDFLDANPDGLTSPEDLPNHALMTGEQFVQYALLARNSDAAGEGK